MRLRKNYVKFRACDAQVSILALTTNSEYLQSRYFLDQGDWIMSECDIDIGKHSRLTLALLLRIFRGRCERPKQDSSLYFAMLE